MKIDRNQTLVIAFAALLAATAAAGPEGKGDDGNSRRHSERNKVAALEQSYEVEKLDVYGQGAGGTVRVNLECEGCAPKSLQIVATTKVFINGKEIPLARVATVDDLQGVVLTKPNSAEITRILAFKN